MNGSTFVFPPDSDDEYVPFQETISNMIGHISSGAGGEVDCAMEILSDLVDSHIDKMKKFDVFIKV